MSKEFNLKSFVIATLRRASYRWKPRSEARVNARTGRNQYTCNSCKGTFSRKETKVDHIQPVVLLSGWDSYEGFIERLFCDISNMQLLCSGCHKIKTKQENEQRKQLRNKK